MECNKNPYLLSSILISLSIVVLGWFLFSGIVRFKDSERIVTVKGLSEKEVKADRVIWPIVYKSAGNDLGSLYKYIESSNAKIVNFLVSNGISETDITVSPTSVTDSDADRYSSQDVKYRYKTISVVTVASNNVDLVRNLMSKQGDLVKEGIPITAGEYEYPTQFTFNQLNEIKPEMIAEATKNGRASAEKFAADSDSKLGKIKEANQGQFSITDRDNNTPYIKIVRVVTTIQYYLKD